MHLQFCKKLLGVKRSTQNDFIYGELGRVPLQNKFFLSILNYWFNILESEESRFIKNAYQLLLNDIANKPNCVNWVSKVNGLLSSLGFHDVWVNQGVGNKRAFLNVCKQRSFSPFH